MLHTEDDVIAEGEGAAVEPIVLAFGSALVAAMATDTWQQARAAVVALWRRFRSAQESSVEWELDGLHKRILDARRTGQESTEAALTGIWQGRLQELVLDNPAMTSYLQHILDQTLIPMLEPAERARVGQIATTVGPHSAGSDYRVIPRDEQAIETDDEVRSVERQLQGTELELLQRLLISFGAEHGLHDLGTDDQRVAEVRRELAGIADRLSNILPYGQFLHSDRRIDAAEFESTSPAGGGADLKNKKTADIKAEEISIVVYLDTDRDATIARVVQDLDDLVDVLGFDGPLRSNTEFGSFFRQSWARIKNSLTSDQAKEIAVKTERAMELRYLDSEQADVDNKVADALSKIVGSIADVPSACIRAGSILLIKYPGPQGSVILTRNLSQLEIRTFEQFPGIQRDPQNVLESLALAMADIRDTGSTIARKS
jgi:hypothetical protein